MEAHKEISDELLAKYISGQTTQDEEAEVMELLSHDDEQISDLLHITEAISAQRHTSGHNSKHRVWWAAAACAVLLLGVASIFANRSHSVSVAPSPLYSAQDSVTLTDTITSQILMCHEE